jgi:hypothetical protein
MVLSRSSEAETTETKRLVLSPGSVLPLPARPAWVAQLPNGLPGSASTLYGSAPAELAARFFNPSKGPVLTGLAS